MNCIPRNDVENQIVDNNFTELEKVKIIPNNDCSGNNCLEKYDNSDASDSTVVTGFQAIRSISGKSSSRSSSPDKYIMQDRNLETSIEILLIGVPP